MKRRTTLVQFTLIGLGCALFTASCANNDYATGAPQNFPTSIASMTRDDTVAAAYRLAKARNLGQLLAMKADAGADAAVALSLFVIDPTKYRDRFVEDYPDSPDGVNGDYGSRLLRSQLLPRGANFPIDAIGRIASAGNRAAAAKLFAAQSQASGIIAEAYDIEAARVMSALPPGDALAVLAGLRPPLRLAAIGETNWCALKPRRILAFNPMPPRQANQSATPLPAPDPTPKRSVDALQRQFAQEQIGRSVALCRQPRALAHERRASRNKNPRRSTGRKKSA